MALFINDIYNEIFKYISIESRISFLSTNKFHRNMMMEDIVISEYIDFITKYNYSKEFSFLNICVDGHFNLAKWFAENNYISDIEYESVCKSICKLTDISILIWLCKIISVKNKKFIQDIFDNCCAMGNISGVIYLFDTYNNFININSKFEYAFHSACENSHINIAKWLYDKNVDIHIWNDYAFRRACECNQLDIAKWLYSLGINFDILELTLIFLLKNKSYNRVIHWLFKIISGDNHFKYIINVIKYYFIYIIII